MKVLSEKNLPMKMMMTIPTMTTLIGMCRNRLRKN